METLTSISALTLDMARPDLGDQGTRSASAQTTPAAPVDTQLSRYALTPYAHGQGIDAPHTVSVPPVDPETLMQVAIVLAGTTAGSQGYVQLKPGATPYPRPSTDSLEQATAYRFGRIG